MVFAFCPLCGAGGLAPVGPPDDFFCQKCNKVLFIVDILERFAEDARRQMEKGNTPALEASPQEALAAATADLEAAAECDLCEPPSTHAKIHDGGPAFPRAALALNDANEMSETDVPGMSLRDWFAGQVVIGQLAARDAGMRSLTPDLYASFSFRVADAMLAERSKRKEARHA